MSIFDCSCFDGETGKLLLKMIIHEEKTHDIGLDEKELKELKNKIKTCGFDSQQGQHGGGGDSGAKPKRKLSEYQIFMGSCMRPEAKGGRGIPMQQCVEEWRESKK